MKKRPSTNLGDADLKKKYRCVEDSHVSCMAPHLLCQVEALLVESRGHLRTVREGAAGFVLTYACAMRMRRYICNAHWIVKGILVVYSFAPSTVLCPFDEWLPLRDKGCRQCPLASLETHKTKTTLQMRRILKSMMSEGR